MTAPELSPAEQATVDRFEAGEPAPESWRPAREWLDELDAVRAQALGFRETYPSLPKLDAVHNDDGDQLVAAWSDGATSYIGETFDEGSADLIVAAVNALPELTARLRAVLDLADEMATAAALPIRGDFDRGVAAHQRDAADRIRAAVDGAR